MQLTELQTLLKRYGFDDKDPITSWLNVGIDWVVDARNWPFLTEGTTVSLTAGNNGLTLPADARRLITAKCVETHNKLDPMERTEFERTIEDPTVTGPPQLYVATDLTALKVYPTPDASYTMRIFYVKNIDRLVNPTDEPQLPVSLHYAIVQAAAAIALQAENEEERAQTAESQFENTIARTWGALSGPASQDEPRTVTDVMGYT